MAVLQLSPQDALFYEHHPPGRHEAATLVFFNALTGDTGAWEAHIAPWLREQGFGTLLYNLRGQTSSPFAPGTVLSSQLVVDDALYLLGEVRPTKPVLVGLSIGGLFAARAWLQGAEAAGLVLVNTLRRDGPRLRWIGDALVRTVEVGGLELFRDLFLELLCNEKWQAENRDNFLGPADYRPLDPQSGHYKLLAEAGRSADWDLPLEEITLPTLIITGLQDRIFLELPEVERQAARLPRARRLDMPEAGHLIPAERPQELARALAEFAGEL